MKLDKALTASEAATLSGTTRQSIYVALKKGTLKCTRCPESGRIEIPARELAAYHMTRYSRLKSKDADGNYMYSPSEGRYSPSMAAQKCHCDVQKIYYLLRIGHLNHTRKGPHAIITDKDLEDCGLLPVDRKNLKT